jgi:hypothetical protein
MKKLFGILLSSILSLTPKKALAWGIAIIASGVLVAALEIDYMEYATDGAAQSAYVTSAGELVVDDTDSHTITSVGDAIISSAQYSSYNSSNSSILFDGTGDCLTVPDSTDWDYGTSFTIDCFVYFSSNNTNQIFAAQYNSDISRWYFGFMSDRFTFYSSSNTNVQALWSPSLSTWYHVAVVRNSGSIAFYVNGTALSLVGNTSPGNANPGVGGNLYIGQHGDDTLYMNAYLDNIRYDKDTALWTSNFALSDANLLYTGSPNLGDLFISADQGNYDLNSFSEDTIITQGTYALKLSATTDALNETVTKTLTGGDILDLTGKNTIKLDARSTGTGSNLEFGIGESNTPEYPPAHSTTYVKVTSLDSADYSPWFSTDPALSLTGAQSTRQWISNSVSTNQRFHIDLGSSKIINRVYYENAHNSGGLTTVGVQNFTLWGSDSSASFAEMTYATDTGWTQITGLSQSTFDEHTGSDVADPKYITITNNLIAYRYYAFKFADDYGYAYMGVRHIELQSNIQETHTINISSADTYQTDSWDISGVSDADKNAIDQLQFKVLNAGSARDFYIDNVYGQ